MTLDPDFSKKTDELIVQTLDLYKKSEASPRVDQVWACENLGDFLCGFFVGEMVGSALGAFQVIHKREPTPEEHMDIVKLVEGHSNDIKEFFARFN